MYFLKQTEANVANAPENEVGIWVDTATGVAKLVDENGNKFDFSVVNQAQVEAIVNAMGFQPSDADLAAIAALTTTSYGRAFLALVDAAGGRTALGLGTAATQNSAAFDAAGLAAAAQAASQPLDADLTAIAALATTAFGRSLLTLASTASVPAGGPIRKTAAQAMTATAQTSITDLAFNMEANATYYFEMSLVVSAAAGTTPTANFQFTGPASPTAVAINREQATSTSVDTVSGVTALSTVFGVGAVVAGTRHVFRGVIVNGANAGIVQLQVAMAGTTPSMTIGLGSVGYFIKTA